MLLEIFFTTTDADHRGTRLCCHARYGRAKTTAAGTAAKAKAFEVRQDAFDEAPAAAEVRDEGDHDHEATRKTRIHVDLTHGDLLGA